MSEVVECLNDGRRLERRKLRNGHYQYHLSDGTPVWDTRIVDSRVLTSAIDDFVGEQVSKFHAQTQQYFESDGDVPCVHDEVEVDTKLHRIVRNSGIRYALDLQIACLDCGEHFVFAGLPVGLKADVPSVSVDHTRARLPVFETDVDMRAAVVRYEN